MVLADAGNCAVCFWDCCTVYAEGTGICITDFVWNFFDFVPCGGNSYFKWYVDNAG